MDSLRDNYREDEDEEDGSPTTVPLPQAEVEPESDGEVPPEEATLRPDGTVTPAKESAVPHEESAPPQEEAAAPPEESPPPLEESAAPMEVDSAGGTEPETPATEPPSEDVSSDEPEKSPTKRKLEEENGEEEEDEGASKKQKQLSSLDTEPTEQQEEEEELGFEQDQPALPQEDANNGDIDADSSANATPLPISAGGTVNGNSNGNGNSSHSKKSKKKNNNVWVTKSTRKGKKKKQSNNNHSTPAEEPVFITPVPRFPDKSDDSLDMAICLSKVYKAEKVELSDDRMSAGSTKGYRMVRATRGVVEGAWYFEIKVVNLGETGHTRLGWSMEKGDLQAPVGYDANSFGYRDIDGSKIHKALREKYGEEGYKEGDVIGFYINLPDGEQYAPKQPQLVWYKGQRYVCAPDPKEDPPKVVPASEISFFRNGICQGVAFKDLCGGRYYPAASMYTLPDQPNCVVKFNFGPEFEFFPNDFEGRPTPRPMVEAPYHGYDSRVENSVPSDKN